MSCGGTAGSSCGRDRDLLRVLWRPHKPSGTVGRVDEPWHTNTYMLELLPPCAGSILRLVSDCFGEYVSGFFVRCLWLFSCVSGRLRRAGCHVRVDPVL